jgi:hypothetical protein
MEQHAVVGGDLSCFVALTGCILRITTAQVARRQHGDRACFIQHGLRGKPHLAEQALRAATREIEHGFGLFAGAVRIADNRDHAVVFDVEQRARGFLRQIARHRFVDEMDHARLQCRLADCGRRVRDLLLEQSEPLADAVSDTLRLVRPFDQDFSHQCN